MKPEQEMHAGVEEVEPDPCDLYLDLTTLIIEGRIPGLTEKGYGEGIHCPPLQGQRHHQCDLTLSECQRQEKLQKHVLLLWKNGIPVSVEVLLYPPCCPTAAICEVESSSVPESCILLEQWIVHMLPRRMSEANVTPRGLIQAVRSFLYFSQLSAWLSLSHGKQPRNVHYRVCVPGEAFSTKFSKTPECHNFPIANVGRNNAMKVVVRYMPRCGEVPTLICAKHAVSCQKRLYENETSEEESGDIVEGLIREVPTDLSSENVFSKNTSQDASNSKKSVKSKPSSSSKFPNAMLGDSLLDPPQSLQMYPKRYQSPSRSGSPSIEAPEHLMLGKKAKSWWESDPSTSQADQKRSRPQRRPVIERFLKGIDTKRSNEVNSLGEFPMRKTSVMKAEALVNMVTKGSNCEQVQVNNLHLIDPFSFADGEVEMVLDGLKPPTVNVNAKHKGGTSNSSSNILIKSSHITNLAQNYSDKNISNESISLPIKFSPAISKDILNNKLANSSTKTTNASFDKHDHIHTLSCSSSKDIALDHLNNVSINSHKPILHSSNYNSGPRDENEHSIAIGKQGNPCSAVSQNRYEDDVPVAKENKSLANQKRNRLCLQLKNDEEDDEVVSKECKENKGKQQSNQSTDLAHSRTWTEGLNNTRGKSPVSCQNQLLKQILKARACNSAMRENVDVRNGYVIPTAAEKAQFRRSLDNATCMVFHRKTALPLTSSPAPLRKTGTCFDFDSSLTTVSAIKSISYYCRALFEKESEAKDTNGNHVLSTSAPASMTTSNLLGNFEECVLNGRLEPVSTVEGFVAEIGASGSFCPKHTTLPVTVFFYTLQDIDKVTTPYLGHINLKDKGYHVPKKGTIQVTLFNPHCTVVKMFVVRYDLCDMPPNSQTFIRQRTLYMPTTASDNDPDSRKWLRYLIHLRFASSRSCRIYLHTDIRMIIFRKSDLDAATSHGEPPYELRSFTQGPTNPRFSPCKRPVW